MKDRLRDWFTFFVYASPLVIIFLVCGGLQVLLADDDCSPIGIGPAPFACSTSSAKKATPPKETESPDGTSAPSHTVIEIKIVPIGSSSQVYTFIFFGVVPSLAASIIFHFLQKSLARRRRRRQAGRHQY